MEIEISLKEGTHYLVMCRQSDRQDTLRQSNIWGRWGGWIPSVCISNPLLVSGDDGGHVVRSCCHERSLSFIVDNWIILSWMQSKLSQTILSVLKYETILFTFHFHITYWTRRKVLHVSGCNRGVSKNVSHYFH